MPKKLKIAMLAPPWLPTPPSGYGGIEYVVHYLSIELKKMGHHVELFTIGESTTRTNKKHWLYKKAQYPNLHQAYTSSVPIPVSHIMYSLNIIKQAGDFDIIHDHNVDIGPAIMANLDNSFPPVLSTLHGSFSDDKAAGRGIADNRVLFSQYAESSRLYFNCISQAQQNFAPRKLRARLVKPVHNAVNPADFRVVTKKSDYFVNVGRIARDKGVGLAAKLCGELGENFKMAGIVSDISTARSLLLELANANSPYRSNDDFKYYSEHILPQLIPGQIEYIGAIFGSAKMKLLGNAKGFLFPIDWEEPFGVAVIDALACGTPVVAMSRGSMPEIIEHGVNGWLADNEKEFKEYMLRIDEIDPGTCRRSVEEKFSAPVLARNYLDRYYRITAKHPKK